MRKKEIKIVVSFHTTTDAMFFEKICKEADVKGRLVPVPKTISTGCGIAWSSPISEKEKIQNLSDHYEPEHLFECLL